MEIFVQTLSRIFFQVRASDSDRLHAAVFQHDIDVSVVHDRQLVLTDLIALRQVRVEVVLAREHRTFGYLTVSRQAELDRHVHRLPVEHRQDTRIA